MKKFPYFALLTLILLSACIKIPLLAAPTTSQTPPPTASQTPQPTASPTPTASQTSTPTATPDVTATAAANATLAAVQVISDLEKVLANEDIPFKEGHLAWQQNEPLKIEMKGPDHEILEIDEKLTAGD